MALIFISYRRDDSAGYAGRLHESLERRLGAGEVFRDVDALEPGQDFVLALHERLRECRAFLAVIGREWLNATDRSQRRLDQQDDYVRLEIEGAFAVPGRLIVPVLVEGVVMPAADDLPESIRGLSRRQAISLRDETWDADVDRLVAAVHKATAGAGWRPTRADASGRRSEPHIASHFGSRPLWAMVVVGAALIVLLAGVFLDHSPPTDSSVRSQNTGGPSRGTEPIRAASAITIPRLAEAAFDELIYTLLSGDVAVHGDAATVRLRIRLSNDGRYSANFWDDTFRLVVQGQTLAPTSGLNEVVGGHTLRQGVVSFEAPASTRQAVLRLMRGQAVADLLLDLSATGRGSDTDRLDTSDALSRAIVRPLIHEPKPLIARQDFACTLTRATVRQFVNTLKIFSSVRIDNRTESPFLLDSNLVRLVIDGEVAAPVVGPDGIAAPHSTVSADFVFDLPTTARTAILRAMWMGTVVDEPFGLRTVAPRSVSE